MQTPDGGMADIVGDVLLVGITVLMAGAVGTLMVTFLEPPEHVSVELRFASDADTLTVTHAGGQTIGVRAADVVATIDDASHRVPLTDCPTSGGNDPDLLEPGEAITVVDEGTRCTGLPSGEVSHVAVTVATNGGGERIVASWSGSVQASP